MDSCSVITNFLEQINEVDQKQASLFLKEIMEYAESDLICYRVPTPEALRKLQDKKWDDIFSIYHDQFDIKLFDPIPIICHFHDTRGMGLANVISAIDEGVKRFDASLGGLGGCPYAPGASGNIATEDCVYMIESMGFSTGIDLKKLLKLRKSLKEWMKNDILYGNLLTSGFAKTFNI